MPQQITVVVEVRNDEADEVAFRLGQFQKTELFREVFMQRQGRLGDVLHHVELAIPQVVDRPAARPVLGVEVVAPVGVQLVEAGELGVPRFVVLQDAVRVELDLAPLGNFDLDGPGVVLFEERILLEFLLDAVEQIGDREQEHLHREDHPPRELLLLAVVHPLPHS